MSPGRADHPCPPSDETCAPSLSRCHPHLQSQREELRVPPRKAACPRSSTPVRRRRTVPCSAGQLHPTRLFPRQIPHQGASRRRIRSKMPPRRKRCHGQQSWASNISNIGFDRVYYFVDTTGEDQFPHGDCEANDLVRLDMGRQRKRIRIGDHINERRTRMLKRLL